jgi:hypothetical protein
LVKRVDRTQPAGPLPIACVLSVGLQESIARCYKADSISFVKGIYFFINRRGRRGRREREKIEIEIEK